MMYKVYYDELTHYGVKGMRKGHRRWTNEDGTLNEAGKRRYGIKDAASAANRRVGISEGVSSNKSETSINSRVSSANSRTGVRGMVSSANSRTGVRGMVSSANSRTGLRSGVSSANSRTGLRSGVSSANSRTSLRSGVSSTKSSTGLGKSFASIKQSIGISNRVNRFVAKNRSKSIRASAHNTVRHSDDLDELSHYGVHGQKWRVRRYQEYDGSLTPAGRSHYGVGPARDGSNGVKSLLGKAGGTAKKITSKAGSKIKERRADREGIRLAKKAKGRGYKKMGDRDLTKAVERLNLEKRYRDLRRDEPSGRAKTFAFELFKNTLNKVVPNSVNTKAILTLNGKGKDDKKPKENKDSKSDNNNEQTVDINRNLNGGGNKRPPRA